jgi:hypothetical protein
MSADMVIRTKWPPHFMTRSPRAKLHLPRRPHPLRLLTSTPARIDEIIGAKGHSNGGVYQIGVARRDDITMDGMAITPAGPMGVATGINFQPTGSGKAAITGDFVLTGDEVNSVVKALRSNSIEVTAIHSHMLGEQPRLFFLHFWANDDAIRLAQALKTALNATRLRTH